ncbi:MAG: Histidine kinase [Chthoniobacteraceae bacterium]|nr:Histidine kinase [Chthoniobacteraceae bacterium]
MFSVLRKHLGKLSIRLTFWHALLFLTAALTVLGLTYLVMQERLLTQERDAIQFRLNQYAAEFQEGGLPAVRMRAALRKGREQKAFFLRVANSLNQTIFLRDADDWVEFEPGQLAEKAPAASVTEGWVTLVSPAGTELLLRFARLPDGTLIEVGRSTYEMRQLLAGFRTATLVVLLIFLPASVGGGAFLASRALRPVQHLTAVAEQIVATASFDARVQSSGSNDELDALVQLFNKMLARIERLVRGMRDSLDNVAHDLRTPMTRLRQKAQTALESAEDIDTTRDALADCVEEAERVMTLLNTLMDIAETEAGLIQFQHVPIDLVELVHSAVDSYSEVAEEKGVVVTDEVQSGLQVSGDAGALRRVFANLLDNAIKFTPAGGRVRITANRIEQSVAIHFADTGSGISPEDLPRIWDRLFRGDKSRSERGLGLGLSFVRAIVESHGGKASVSCELDGGTRATILLPAETVTG